jgi:hypothetical protein
MPALVIEKTYHNILAEILILLALNDNEQINIYYVVFVSMESKLNYESTSSAPYQLREICNTPRQRY